MKFRPTPGIRFLQVYFASGALLLGTLLFFYSRALIRQLESETQVRSRIYARFVSRVVESPESSSPELDIIFDEVVRKIDFPVIVTDSVGNPVPGGYRNLPERRPSPEQLRQWIRKLDAERPPIAIYTMRGADTVKLQEIHYGLSGSARLLRVYPFFQVSLLILFLLLGVWGIVVYDRRERERIWTALAKETAHQLATPLSSLSGWLEVLRERNESPEIVSDLVQDLERMNEILERFSRIGHQPELKRLRLRGVIERSCAFVQRRAPRSVKFEVAVGADPEVDVDEVLLAWTIENLLRNAVDAIGQGPGLIRVTTAQAGQDTLEISVTDTGEGIAASALRNIFKPGVTTKKYGWGVGLTLAKRIVEEYHRGRLFVKEWRPRQTTFVIILPIAQKE